MFFLQVEGKVREQVFEDRGDEYKNQEIDESGPEFPKFYVSIKLLVRV